MPMPVAPVPCAPGADSPFTPADIAVLHRWERVAPRSGAVVLRDIDEETGEESLLSVRAHDGVPYVAIGLTTPANGHDDRGSNDNEPEIAYQVIPSAGAWGVFNCDTADWETYATLQEALEAVAPMGVTTRNGRLRRRA